MTTVSIVTYHTPESELRHCLECLAASEVHTVFVVDNACDESTRAIAAQYPHTVYTQLPNPGYGTAHNWAIRQVMDWPEPPAYHIVMNTDLSFDPAVPKTIADYMDLNPEVGAIQPRIVGPDGQRQFTCRMLPTPNDLILRRFLPKRFMTAARNRYLLKHLDPDQPHNIPYHQGSFMFLRLEALRREGLFDERFFMYPEDIDLTRRLHRNWLTLYWPGATIMHLHRAESYQSARMLRIHMVNMVRYFNKWGWFYDPERTRFNARIK